MSPYILVFTLRYVWLIEKGGAGSKAEAMSQEMEPRFTGPLNHTTPTNMAGAHFCIRKWFRVSKWEWAFLTAHVYIWQSYVGKKAPLQSPTFRLIIWFCAKMFSWDIFRPQTQGSPWLYIFIFSIPHEQLTEYQSEYRWTVAPKPPVGSAAAASLVF